MSTKLGKNPFEANPDAKPTIFPGDPLSASKTEAHASMQEEEPTMTTKRTLSKAKAFRNTLKISWDRKQLLRVLDNARQIDASAISRKILSCRMERFSLVQFSSSGRSSTLSLLGVDISHGFAMKNRNYRVGPLQSRGWKVTLLNLQLRKGTGASARTDSR
ncbi:MAG: hypothetical protein RJB38_2391 [Pseudomonadota bacterium]|jgi:hypothetical protein